jgi:hypothetical protein
MMPLMPAAARRAARARHASFTARSRRNALRQFHSVAALVAACFVAECAAADAQPVQVHTPTPAPYTSTVGAHARYSKARINLAPPNLALTGALIAAGGGPAAFDAQKLVGALTGNGPLTQTELAALTKKFGAQNVASFMKTFDFVISDGLAQAANAGIVLPAPAPDLDGKALAAALYAAGVSLHTRYDVEYMLDALFSHVIHVAVMNDIDADPNLGPAADANYHAVLLQTMLDLDSAYKLESK